MEESEGSVWASVRRGELEPRPVLERISVVIPTLGRPILGRCLASIAAGSTWPGWLIVVDQGSSQRVADWVASLSAAGLPSRYLASSERGRACGVNRGIERTETPFFAVTDDDCTVDAAWLETMERRLADHPRSIVTGRVDVEGEVGGLFVVTSRQPALYHRPALKFDRLSGGNMGTSREVVERVGLLDEAPALRCAEDGEWAYRALRSGVPILYDPEIAVVHHGWRDPEQQRRQLRSYARSHGAFYGSYLRRGDWFIAARSLVHHARALQWWIRGVARRDRQLVVFGRAYLLGLLPGMVAGLRSGGSAPRLARSQSPTTVAGSGGGQVEGGA